MRAEPLISKSLVPLDIGTSRSKVSREFLIVTVLTLIHLPLGITLYNTGSAGILHPIGVFGFGLFIALRKRVNNAHVAYVAAYIVGAEVLWRMASVPIFWEFGKYAPATILLVAIFRSQRFEVPKLALLYFMLLVPACLITIAESNMSRSLATLSSNISGPFLFFVSAWFFYKIRISPPELRRLLVALILPVLSIAMSALFYTVTAEEISFTGESNFATSGGFGPNQVSSMLGLGVFAAAAGLLIFKKHSKFSFYFAVSALVCATLCIMTFSRSGMYNALAGIAVLLIFGMRDVSVGIRRVVPAIILGAVFLFFIYPVLNDYTGGALQERFEDTGTSQRSSIAYSDLQIFMENPVFGVGLGASYFYRERFLFHKAMAHTEFTRLLAEHGLFGFAALVVLLAIFIANLMRPNSVHSRAFIAGGIVWACMYMSNAAMRLGAPGFMLGLSFITIVNIRPHLARVVLRTKREDRSKVQR